MNSVRGNAISDASSAPTRPRRVERRTVGRPARRSDGLSITGWPAMGDRIKKTRMLRCPREARTIISDRLPIDRWKLGRISRDGSGAFLLTERDCYFSPGSIAANNTGSHRGRLRRQQLPPVAAVTTSSTSTNGNNHHHRQLSTPPPPPPPTTTVTTISTSNSRRHYHRQHQRHHIS